MEKDKQNFKNNEHSCGSCNNHKEHCNLRETEIKAQSGLAEEALRNKEENREQNDVKMEDE